MTSRIHLVGQLQKPGSRPENVEFYGDERGAGILIQDLTDGDTTPSVAKTDGASLYRTANTSPTTITDFDDGGVGRVIDVIINDANTTIDFTSSGLKGNQGADWSPTTGDHMTCVYDGTDWYCNVSDNTA